MCVDTLLYGREFVMLGKAFSAARQNELCDSNSAPEKLNTKMFIYEQMCALQGCNYDGAVGVVYDGYIIQIREVPRLVFP